MSRINQQQHTNLLTNTFRSRSTNASEHETFRRRNHVQATYSGPVYVTEEVYVPCSGCMAPVNPVERVPVGKSWYHPQCLHCQICKKGTRTTAFYSVNGAPVCASCHRGPSGMIGNEVPKPDKRSFLADHNILLLSNGVKLDARTTTVRQAVLMEKQALVNANDINFTLTIPRGGSFSQSPERHQADAIASPASPLSIAASPHSPVR